MSQSLRLGMTIQQTTNHVKYVEVTAERVESFLSSQGISPTYKNTSDEKYCIIEEEWFTKTLLPEYLTFLSDTGMKEYIVERNDCDDFSRTLTFFSKMKSLKTLNVNYNFALGDVFYHKNGDKKHNHAINLAIVLDKDAKLKLIYIEPQDATIFDDNRAISRHVYFWGM